MKKVILAIIILAIILTAGVLENVYVDRLFDTLDEKLDALENDIVSTSDGANPKVDELINWWGENRKYAELFLYSPDIRALSVALGEVQGSLECGDFDNALSKVRSIKIMSANLRDMLDFNIADII